MSRQSPFDSVLRQDVVKAGRPCVTTQQLCRDKVAQQARQKGSIATDFVVFSVATEGFHRDRLCSVFYRDRDSTDLSRPFVATEISKLR